MTNSEKYSDYKWIKVKRSKPISIDGVSYVNEKHHIEETNFLIEEIRKLAKEFDDYVLSSKVEQK